MGQKTNHKKPGSSRGKRKPLRAVCKLTLELSVKTGDRLRDVSRRTGMFPDQVASHLLEAAAASPGRVTLKRSTDKGLAQAHAVPSARPLNLVVGITSRVNDWLYKKAVANGFRRRGEDRNLVARVVLAKAALDLPVFSAAVSDLKVLHQQRLRNLDTDLSAAMQERRRSKALAPSPAL